MVFFEGQDNFNKKFVFKTIWKIPDNTRGRVSEVERGGLD
jgi:hypothetical protein